ncbi:MAG: hypothetical protein GIKADHBN_03027 [Phycisphaerales bacterium]|nr:hypothetical protein [Phycisphaerales bacterium]
MLSGSSRSDPTPRCTRRATNRPRRFGTRPVNHFPYTRGRNVNPLAGATLLFLELPQRPVLRRSEPRPGRGPRPSTPSFQHGIGVFVTTTGLVAESGGACGPVACGLPRAARRLGPGTGSQQLVPPLGPRRRRAQHRRAQRPAAGACESHHLRSGGDLNMFCCTLPGVKRTPEPAQPIVLIVAQPATGFPPGCSSVASCARSPTTGPAPFDRFASYKTLSY